MPSFSSSSSSSNSQADNEPNRGLNFFRTVAHILIVLGPLFISSILINSDSMLNYGPKNNIDDLDVSENITTVGFGIQKFSTNGTEDIWFSETQQDMFGQRYDAAYTTYFAFTTIMWIALILPLALRLILRFCCKATPNSLEFSAKVARDYSIITSPILIVMTLLMIVPFLLLWNSSLCGPNYLELQYELEPESSSFSSDEESENFEDNFFSSFGNHSNTASDVVVDHHQHHYYHYHGHEDGCGPDYEGTVAFLHDDIPTSCSIGTSGKVFLSLAALYPLILMVHACILFQTGQRLDREITNRRARAELNNAGPVIKVLEDDDDNHDVSMKDDYTEDGSIDKRFDIE